MNCERLASAVCVLSLMWLVVDLTLGMVVAPACFANAPPRGTLISREQAGLVFGEVLARWQSLTLWPLLVIVGSAAAILWSAWQTRARGCALALLALGLALVPLYLVQHQLMAEAMPISRKLADGTATTAERVHFTAHLHGRSMLLYAIEMGLLAAIAVLAGILAWRRWPLRTQAQDAAPS